MRGLYWLTAITLVAAAVTTVAIADYSRRHAGPAFGGLTGGPVTKPVTTLMQPADEPAAWVTSPSEPKKLAWASDAPQPGTPPACMPVEQVPEHEQLKAKALGGLGIMQDKPAAPTYPPTVLPPVADEFTFPGTGLPAQKFPIIPPAAQATLPPPTISTPPADLTGPAATPAFQSVPEFKPDANAGPEVLPGLRASKAEPKPGDDNPIRDCLAASGELVTLLTPLSYLDALPAKPKCDGPACTASTAAACPKTCQPPHPMKDFDGPWQVATPSKAAAQSTCVTDSCTFASHCAPASNVGGSSVLPYNPFLPPSAQGQGPACCAAGVASCCTAAGKLDDVVVRTYSVAEFGTGGNNSYQDLIQLITNMIAPESWDTKDSNVVYFAQGRCLVVRHKASVQKEVDDLLSQLRTAVQKHTPARVATIPPPIIHMEPTSKMPADLEMVPMPPVEGPMCRPRVITNEPCPLGDDEFFGMVPTRMDGRLFPVPTRFDMNPLLPAGFNFLEEGPAGRVAEKRVPDFFPLMLPYAPLPSGPETCEEEKLKTVDVQKTSLEGPVKSAPAMPMKK